MLLLVVLAAVGLSVLKIGAVALAAVWISNWRHARRVVKALEGELRLRVVDGRGCHPNLDDFKLQLSKQYIERAQEFGYVHLKRVKEWYCRTRLKELGPGIILSGPSEICLRELAKEVAKAYEAKLLILDLTEFNAMVWHRYGTSFQPKWMWGQFTSKEEESKVEDPYRDTLLITSLDKVIQSFSSPFLLYIRDCNDFMSSRIYPSFQRMVRAMDKPLLILGSRMRTSQGKKTFLYPFNSAIESRSKVYGLIRPLEEDEGKIGYEDYINIIVKRLGMYDVQCNDMKKLTQEDIDRIMEDVERAVVIAMAHHLKNYSNDDDNFIISSDSLIRCLNLSPDIPHAKVSYEKKPMVSNGSASVQTVEKKNVEMVQTVEKKNDEMVNTGIGEIIPPSMINVTFDDIGALDNVKIVLYDAIIHPMKHPNLYKTGLLQPCCGVLLFGPPGTGKTMLAKAIAREANTTFISVSPSSILSSMFAESSHNVRDLFARANQLSPSIIFIDEIDGMLGERRKEENETYRSIKTEFMAHWDGLTTQKNVIVLGTTNRPFDLDDAILRRFERRIYVGLPSLDSREKILKKIMKDEEAGELDYFNLAKLTTDYSASDLKTLCKRAAYIRLREHLELENGAVEGCMKPFKMEHFTKALKHVAHTYSSATMSQLKSWNNKFGEEKSKTDEEVPFYIV